MKPKCAFVTGVTQGLGAFLARKFVEEGWTVVGLGRRPLGDPKIPHTIKYLQIDLSDENDVTSLVERLDVIPDLVVHNAVTYPPQDDSTLSFSELEKVFRTNAFSPYRINTDILRVKRPDQFISFVGINSEAIYHADAKSGVYAASKAALLVLTSAFANICRGQNASSATLLLGPLANPGKIDELRRVAEKRGVNEKEITKIFLRKSNPDLVIEELIDFEACFKSLLLIESLGAIGNGMVCKLDGGSSGSLI